MFNYDDQFNTVQGLIKHYDKLCKHNKTTYTHETESLPASLQELREIILMSMGKENKVQAKFTDKEHLYQIMWFAKIPDKDVLRTLLNGLLDALNKPLQQPHILQVFVFVCQQSDKTLLEDLWLGDLVEPIIRLIEACAKIVTPDNTSRVSTALTELNLLFDEMVKRSVKLADQYKKRLKQLTATSKEIVKYGKQEKFYELSDKIAYAQVALTAVPSYLTRKEKLDLVFDTIAVVGHTLELVAAGLALPVTFGLSSILLIKDAALLANQVRELSKDYPDLTETKKWYGFVQNIRQLIALNVLNEKQVPDITPDEMTQLWNNFETKLFSAISEEGKKIHFNISLLPGLVHVVESLANLILLGNRAESLAVSIATQETIIDLILSIYHLKVKKGVLKGRFVKTYKDLITNLKTRIEIYLQAFARLPAQDHVIESIKVQALATSLPEVKQVAEQQIAGQITSLLNKFKTGQDTLLFTSNLVHQAWEKSLSYSYVYYKLLLHSRNELTKAVLDRQNAIKQKALYVKPMCREDHKSNSASDYLRTRLNTFLAPTSNQRVLWLLGDPGSGKTCATHELTEQLLDEYEPGKYLPVLITLPSYNEPQHCLRTLFSEILHGHGDYLKVMSNIKQDNNQPLVFIFEAYDEVFTTEPFDVYSGARANLQSNHLEDWPNIKVFITVRTNYKPDEKSFKRLLRNCPPEQQAIIYLEPFNKTQIGWYLENFLTVTEKKKPENSRLDRLMRKIMQPAIKSLAQNPLFLSYLVKELALLDEEMTQSIRLSLYDRLLTRWFERAEVKLKNDALTLDVIEEFVKELAFRMFKQQTVTAPDLTYRTEFLRFWNTEEPVIQNLFENPDFKKLLHGSPLKRVMQLPEAQAQQQQTDKRKGYKFIHDTIRTYYLAKYLFDQLISPDFNVAEDISINDCITSKSHADNTYAGVMQTPSCDEVVDFLVELINSSESKDRLTNRMYELMQNNNKHYNALCLSVLIRGDFQSFYRKNLSRLNMSYANLNGGVFQHTDFLNSIFDHANLNGVLVGNARFNGASFRNVTLSVNSSGNYPIKVAINGEKKWVISYDSINDLAIRNLVTGEVVSTKSFQDNIADIALLQKTHEIAVLTKRSESAHRILHFYQLNEANSLAISNRESERLPSEVSALISFPSVEALCWSCHNELVWYNLANQQKTVRKVHANREITVRKTVVHWRRLASLLSNHRVAIYKRDDLLAIDQNQELKLMLLLNPNQDPIEDIALCTSGQTWLRVVMAKEQRIVIANFKFDENGEKVGQSLHRIESKAMYLAFCGFDYVVWARNHDSNPTPEQRQRSNMFFKKLDMDCATKKHDYNHDPNSMALLGHAEAVTDIASEAEDRMTFVSAGEDGVIHRWELDTENNSWKVLWRSSIGLHARGCVIEGASLSEEDGEKLKAFGARGQYDPLDIPPPPPHVDPVPLPQPEDELPDIGLTPDQPIEPDFDY